MSHDPDGGVPQGKPEAQDWTNSYQPLEVNVDSLTDYYRSMLMELMPQVGAMTATTLAPMPQFVDQGLLGLGGSLDPQAGVFPEGVAVAGLMLDNEAAFKAFLHDVSQGINCIANAAGVIAEIYRNGDAENSSKLGDVAFAFGDPDATTPKGLPKGASTMTLSEKAAQANPGGGYSMAATLSPDQASNVIHPANGVTIYLFDDGSSQTVTRSSDSNSWAITNTTTTTIYADGKVVGTTTKNEITARGGYRATTTSQTPGKDPHAPGAVSTVVTTNPDQSQTITTTTYGPDGKPTTSNPITVQPQSPSSQANDDGPIQQAENQYKTQGGKDYVDDHGAGY
jgi:hypothetical protein